MVRQPAVAVAARYARGNAIAAVVLAGFWHVANDVPGIVEHWSGYGPHDAAYVSVAAWFVYAGVGVVAATLMLRGQQSAVFELGSLTLLLLGTLIITAQSPAVIFGSGDWAWGSFGWYALLVLWRRPLRHLLAALAANGAAVLAGMVFAGSVGRLDLSRWAMSVYGTAVLQVVFAVGARLLERDATRAAESAAAHDEIATARRAAQQAHEDWQRRYRDTTLATSELLTGLAEGNLDPLDPATQRRAAIEAARLRRLIAEHDDVPDPLVHELRASADLASRGGIAVELNAVGAVPELPAQIRRLLTEAPLHILASARTAARVTVAGNPHEVCVSVYADADTEPDVTHLHGHEQISVDCHREGEHLWLQTTWRARSPSRSSTTTPSFSPESVPGSLAARASGSG